MSMNKWLIKHTAIAATVTSSIFVGPSLADAHFFQQGSKTLYKGTNDDDVKTLQEILRETGHYKIKNSTGYFGHSTEKAVKSFQSEENLQVDGIVGEQTKKALFRFIAEKLTLKMGNTGEDVKQLQNVLNKKGYYQAKMDGVFGSLTKEAVMELQKNNNITVDGIVGPETYRFLGTSENRHKTSPTSKSSESTGRSQSTVHKQSKVIKKDRQEKEKVTTRTVKEFFANSTGYTAYCSGCSGVTASGIDLRSNPEAKVVAVDPNVIPLGTKLYVEGYGYAVAADTGGAIKGMKIDLFFNDNSEALDWGRRTVKVKVLE
ncbi:peptidoglycan-binding protein [Terrilactibacillus sp. BCM23-1]|uniref:Peptidoglycan-binding protein n=1 Tax=Terrilactibacillus tamarindi TaxID=2599694 RepID=A0A6N8CSH0_9BACI|nr:peptidoglycan-binding protein [Terrilactibacillus tamarindi]MTT33149.1 peptidoglycan-binding protein [Terrilactibacillus tamarindi]